MLVRGGSRAAVSSAGTLHRTVTVGASLFLIAAGAILRYAVTWRNSDVDIPAVGLILLIVGVIGLIVSIAYMVMATDRRRDTVVRERDPHDPY